MVLPTDKSNKLSISSVESYITSMKPYMKKDPVITLKEKNSVEDILNGHTLQIGRILKIGEK